MCNRTRLILLGLATGVLCSCTTNNYESSVADGGSGGIESGGSSAQTETASSSVSSGGSGFGSSESTGGASVAETTAVELVCEPGKSEACPCYGGGESFQTCKEDGSGWEACDCSGLSWASCVRVGEMPRTESNPTYPCWSGSSTALWVGCPKMPSMAPSNTSGGGCNPTQQDSDVTASGAWCCNPELAI